MPKYFRRSSSELNELAASVYTGLSHSAPAFQSTHPTHPLGVRTVSSSLQTLICFTFMQGASESIGQHSTVAEIQKNSGDSLASPSTCQGCSQAACGSVSRRTRIPARASMLISLSMLKRLISPFSKLLIRGCVSPKKAAASACVQPRA